MARNAAILVGICVLASPPLNAEDFPFLPLRLKDSHLPLLARERALDGDDIVRAHALDRSGEHFRFLSDESELTFIQKTHEDLWIQSDTPLRLTEINGAMEVERSLDDAWLRADTRHARQLRIRLARAGSVQIKALRYEDAVAYSQGWFRPLSLGSAKSAPISQTLAADENFALPDQDVRLQLPSAGLLRLRTRRLYEKADPEKTCLLRFQEGKKPLRSFLLRSYPSDDAVMDLRGENRAVGIVGQHYVSVKESTAFWLWSDCAISAEFSPENESAKEPWEKQSLLAALSQGRLAGLSPLEALHQLEKSKAQDPDFRNKRAAANYLRSDYLYWKALYPADPRSEESLQWLQGSLHQVKDPDAQELEIPRWDMTLPVWKLSRAREKIHFPLAQQAWTKARLIAGKPGESAVYFLEQYAGSRLLEKSRINMHADAPTEAFSSLEFSVHPKATTLVLSRDKSAAGWPSLSLQILDYRSPSLDVADRLSQLADPQRGFIAEMIEGKDAALPPYWLEKIRGLQWDLRERARILTSTAPRLEQSAQELDQASREGLRDGQYLLVKDLCAAGLKGRRSTRRVAQVCLENAFRSMNDYSGLAVTAAWRYAEETRWTHVKTYADALEKMGHISLATMIKAEAALDDPEARDGMMMEQSKDLIADENARAFVPRSYASYELLRNRINGRGFDAFRLDSKEALILENPKHDDLHLLIELREEWAQETHEKALRWLQIQAENKSYELPYLLSGQSGDLEGRYSLAAPLYLKIPPGARFHIRADAPLLARLREANLQLSQDVSQFPEDPEDPEFLLAFSQLRQLEREGKEQIALETKGRMLHAIRAAKEISWPQAQRARILEEGTRWVPLAAGDSPSQLWKEDYQVWSPDSPAAKVQKAFFPAAPEDTILVLSGDEEQFSEIELDQAQNLRFKAQVHSLAGQGALQWKLDEQPWQTLNRKEWEVPLSPGRHRIGLRFRERSAQRILYLQAWVQNKDGWQALANRPSKYWAAASKLHPLEIRLPRSGLVRMHRMPGPGIKPMVQYRYVQAGSPLLLKDEAYYRLYALNSFSDQRPSLIANLPLKKPLLLAREEKLLEAPSEARKIYHVNEAMVHGLGLEALSNCSEDDGSTRRACADYSQGRLFYETGRFTLDDDLRLSLSYFPGKFWAGLATADYERKLNTNGLILGLGASGYQVRYTDDPKRRVGGGTINPRIRQESSRQVWDNSTELSATIRGYRADRNLRLDEKVPRAVLSPWKMQHDRSLRLGQDFTYRPDLDQAFRMAAFALSNPPDQKANLDQAAFGISWFQSWSRSFSSKLGYDIRYYFVDEDRADYTLRYGPHASFYAVNYGILDRPLFLKIESGVEPDSTRTVFLASLEMIFGEKVHPDSARLVNFPFESMSRSKLLEESTPGGP